MLKDPVMLVEADRVAVIGDIHGHADQLGELLRQVPGRQIVVVGDVCDRGPHTRRVIDLLIEHRAVGVVGNHEEWLLSWINGDGFDPFALHPIMGGAATLQSYGIRSTAASEIEPQRFAVPSAHRDWLNRLVPAIDLRVGEQRYWVIHAGISKPEAGQPLHDVVPTLAREKPQVLRWTEMPPHEAPQLDRRLVVGHRPNDEAVVTDRVIAIDTGAGTAGKLSALLLPELVVVSA